ncbi:hypothetical protein [Roseofilum sp. Guam]|uniref:hypothetical protein n=1 Tax=Roseofilum sp. Guam TaxID=2821502 RepID=UPI001B2F21E1|nr:hypothetical protein [Roseofilum sp. Guam]MBP0028937.1 hypothetical protein [Roseofilum sp. Guam]
MPQTDPYPSDLDDSVTQWFKIDRLISEMFCLDFQRDRVDETIKKIESELQRKVPIALQNWLGFAQASWQLEPKGFTFRDSLEVKRMRDCESYQILCQAEQDMSWAVKYSDFDLEDPPVYLYYLDYESPNPCCFEAGQWSPTIASFMLDYLFTYTTSCHGGFSIDLEKIDLSVIEQETGALRSFGHLKWNFWKGILLHISQPYIFEEEENWECETLHIELLQPQSFNALPASIRQAFFQAGCVSNNLIELIDVPDKILRK